jgi:molybdopterin converting factor small subunit
MWITIGGLLVSILALWRAGRLRVLDLRTTLRNDAAELRLALENLAATIPAAVQSRERLAAATGQAGAFQQFRLEAETDRATVETLRARLSGIEPIPLLASYDTVEAKVVTAHEVRLRVQQLREKYTAAAAGDAQEREYLRAAAEARARAAQAPEAWG